MLSVLYPKSTSDKKSAIILPEFPDPMKNMKEESTKVDFIRALKVDANGTSLEIKSYLESLKRSGDKFDSVDDYVEDFKNYVADKSLQEHFGRFMKDYQYQRIHLKVTEITSVLSQLMDI